MPNEAPNTELLFARAAAGDAAAWGALLTAHQERLARMVAFRMDPRLRGRIDAPQRHLRRELRRRGLRWRIG